MGGSREAEQGERVLGGVGEVGTKRGRGWGRYSPSRVYLGVSRFGRIDKGNGQK